MTDEVQTLDMTGVMKLLDDARGIAEEMHGQKVNIEGLNNKGVMSSKAHINKQLLYGAHLADLARAEMLNQYHTFKGENPPQIIP